MTTNEARKNGMQTSDCTKYVNFMVRACDETLMRVEMAEKAVASWGLNKWSNCRQILGCVVLAAYNMWNGKV